MKCPNCGAKLYVADSVPLPEGDEMYRLRFCKECGEFVYTTEFIVQKTDAFMKSWYENHRKLKNNPRHYKHYTPAELKYIKTHCDESVTMIAARMGRTLGSVKKYVYKFRKEKEKKNGSKC